MKSILASSIMLLAAVCVLGEPYIPKEASVPLERLRVSALDSSQHELRKLRAQLSADPTNATLAAQFARGCIEKYRVDLDPRYLGRAQAALVPWWKAATPPVPILVLRASIKQSQHDFTGALADLDIALHAEPRNPQAWLMRATVLTVVGDYAQARRSCAPLAQLAPGLIAVTAAATVNSLSGDAERSCNLLRNMLDGNSQAAPAEKEWALTALGEMYVRLGRKSEAESCFKKALALVPRDPYLLGAYADLLMDSGRSSEAAELLKDETRVDGLLLRLALAEAAVVPQPADFPQHVADVKARFEAGHLRGDFVHQREEARFDLCLLHRPADALELAQANWQVQHEPVDVRILIETANAAGQPNAAKPAWDFVKNNHLEDVTLK